MLKKILPAVFVAFAIFPSLEVFGQVIDSRIRIAVDKAEINSGQTIGLRLAYSSCEGIEAKTPQISESDKARLREEAIEFTGFSEIKAAGGICYSYTTLRAGELAVSGSKAVTLMIDGEPAVQFEPFAIQVKKGADSQQPIPTKVPQVDVFWGVVSKDVTKDNFGSRIANRFYAVEVVIGNNSGHDLQIAAVGFELGPIGASAESMARTHEVVAKELEESLNSQVSVIKELSEERIRCANSVTGTSETKEDECRESFARLQDKLKLLRESSTKIVAETELQLSQQSQLSRLFINGKIPVRSYRAARGTASYGQFVNIRTFGLSLLRAIGPVLTGLNPFFGAGEELKYTQLVSVITNPVAEGIGSVFPDRTVPQLQRLDDQMLRDGTIIPNNRQVRTLVLIDKKVLRLPDKHRNNVPLITQSLGELHLIGDLVKYVNRVSVTASGSGAVQPPPTLNPTSLTFVQGDQDAQLRLTGTNLQGAQLFSAKPELVKIQSESTTSTSNSVSAPISVEERTEPQRYTVYVQTPSGTAETTILVSRAEIVIDEGSKSVSTNDKNVKISSSGFASKTHKVEIKGNYLSAAQVSPDEASTSVLNVVSVEAFDDGKRLVVEVSVNQGTPSGIYKLKITNPGDASSSQDIEFVIENESLQLESDVRFGFNGNGPLPMMNPVHRGEFDFSIDGMGLESLKGISVQKAGSKVEGLDAMEPTYESGRLKARLSIPPNLKGDVTLRFETIDGNFASKTVPVLDQGALEIDRVGSGIWEISVVDQQARLELTGKYLLGLEAELGSDSVTQQAGLSVLVDPSSSTDKNATLTFEFASGTLPNEPVTIKLKNKREDGNPVEIKVRFTNRDDSD